MSAPDSETLRVCVNLAANTIIAALDAMERRPDHAMRRMVCLGIIRDTAKELRDLVNPAGGYAKFANGRWYKP